MYENETYENITKVLMFYVMDNQALARNKIPYKYYVSRLVQSRHPEFSRSCDIKQFQSIDK